jgi:hypothetical protein
MTREYNEEMIEVAIKHIGHEVLSEAAAEAEEGTDTVSEQFDKRMRALIRRKTALRAGARTMQVLYRVAAILLVVIVIFAVAVVSSEALRVKVINLLYGIQGGNAQISFTGADPDNLPEGIVIPDYLPKGYELAEASQDGLLITSRYENEAGDAIEIRQDTLNVQIGAMQGAATETEIAGRTAYIIDTPEDKAVIFSNDWNSFVISGDIDVSELLIMAESILE